MTSEENVRPYHAKEKASGQEAADAVAAVLKHAAARDDAAQVKPKRKTQSKWLLPVGINMAVFAVYLLIAPPDWVVMSPIEAPPAASRVAGMRTAMWLQAQRIEAFRIENGSLPLELGDTGSPVPGVDYVVVGSTFRLVADVGEETLVFDSSTSGADWVSPEAANKLRGG